MKDGIRSLRNQDASPNTPDDLQIMKISSFIIAIILAITGTGLLLFGIYYGNERPEENIESVTDIDRNVYRAVKIGAQVWMAENLKVTHYRDGSPIHNVQGEEEWGLLHEGAYCLFPEDPSGYKETYGCLYNFYAVEDRRGLAPEGWHVPTASEWRELIIHLGGDAIGGSKMKATLSKLWKIVPPGSSNESGFSALPAGGRGRRGEIGEVGYYATWWSSTSPGSMNAWHWGLHPDKNSLRYNPGHKASGFSVRCVKNR